MVPTYTINRLAEMRVTKAELFEQHVRPFDFALPQEWLNAFANWCKTQAPNLTYRLITSTTVWSYAVSSTGIPLSACREVAEALRDYGASRYDD